MIEAELPDGTVLEFPPGTSQDVIQRVVKQRLGVDKPQDRSQLAALGGAVGQGVGNVALGAQNLIGMGVEKLGGIGKTKSVKDLIVGEKPNIIEQAGQWLQKDAATGKAKLQGEIDPYQQQHPLTVAGGRFAGEVAATLPVGGILGKAVGAVPGASGLAAALRSGGAVGPNLATRVAGGALTGGALSALINPNEAGTGAVIGGALPIAGKVLSYAGPAMSRALGGTTGVGTEAVEQAFKAGKEGGRAGAQFAANLRGQAPMDEVLSMAKQNLQAMGQQRQQAYRAGMANVKADKAILSFDGIDDAIKNAMSIGSFKGQPINDKAFQAVSQASDEVRKWKSLNPAEFHTPEGLDALKQRIGSLLESLDPVKEGQARKAVGGIYDSIKTQIGKQAPEYSKVMRDYSEASDLIREIEGSLSLGAKARSETAMRKLQSLMRNNVNTSYGYRDELANALRNAGGQDIMPALAGQAMSDWMPRGMQRAAVGTGGAGLAYTGNVPAAAALAATSSPRLVGEGAYAAGRAAGAVNPAVINALRKGVYKSAPVIAAQE